MSAFSSLSLLVSNQSLACGGRRRFFEAESYRRRREKLSSLQFYPTVFTFEISVEVQGENGGDRDERGDGGNFFRRKLDSDT